MEIEGRVGTESGWAKLKFLRLMGSSDRSILSHDWSTVVSIISFANQWILIRNWEVADRKTRHFAPIHNARRPSENFTVHVYLSVDFVIESHIIFWYSQSWYGSHETRCRPQSYYSPRWKSWFLLLSFNASFQSLDGMSKCAPVIQKNTGVGFELPFLFFRFLAWQCARRPMTYSVSFYWWATRKRLKMRL